METLEEAYRIAKSNGGAAGIDGQKFEDIETAGRSAFLAAVREDLITGRYKPMPNRKVDIPKGNGKFRTLQIPCIRDRVVQGAVKLILEAVFEAIFAPRISTEAVATQRTGGSQAQCVAAHVYSH
jgi:retron-type reverse transcriptase